MEAMAQGFPAEVAVDEEGWVRRRSRRLAFGSALAVLNAGFYLVVAAIALSGAETLGEALFGLGMAIVLFGWIVWLSARAAIRIPRAGVRVGREEVTVLGPVRTWRVPLEDAVGFVSGQQRSWFALEFVRSAWGVVLERRHGPPVPIFALRGVHPTSAEGAREAEERWGPVCDWLNAALASRRGGGWP